MGKRYLILIVLVLGIAYLLINSRGSEGRIFEDTGTIEVHFCPVEDCERIMTKELNGSDNILCAFYDFGLEDLEKLLLQKDADILIFEENREKLPDATPVQSRGLMHDKFCILDSQTVITGSMNPTVNGATKNDNNLLIVESPLLARNYLAEFAELERGGNRQTAYQQVNLSGILIENYFCPEDGCEKQVLDALEQAEDGIIFMTFTFTSDPIGDLLAEKARDGVRVAGVFEARQRSQYWEYEKLESAGANVTTDTNPNTMHHKVFIIDPDDPVRATVITGSYNPTASANERNDENILIIHDQAIAQRYVKEFDRVWPE